MDYIKCGVILAVFMLAIIGVSALVTIIQNDVSAF